MAAPLARVWDVRRTHGVRPAIRGDFASLGLDPGGVPGFRRRCEAARFVVQGDGGVRRAPARVPPYAQYAPGTDAGRVVRAFVELVGVPPGGDVVVHAFRVEAPSLPTRISGDGGGVVGVFGAARDNVAGGALDLALAGPRGPVAAAGVLPPGFLCAFGGDARAVVAPLAVRDVSVPSAHADFLVLTTSATCSTPTCGWRPGRSSTGAP